MHYIAIRKAITCIYVCDILIHILVQGGRVDKSNKCSVGYCRIKNEDLDQFKT